MRRRSLAILGASTGPVAPRPGPELRGQGRSVPYAAANYCVNASLQYHGPNLSPLGHLVRLTQHTWDRQLNALHPSSAGGGRTFIGDYSGNTVLREHQLRHSRLNLRRRHELRPPAVAAAPA